jgi:exodeoxyribonuclease VII large subunit
MPEQPKPYTVTAITRIIKATLEESFPGIWVEGEVSGYLHHTSGHRYLSLKDDRAVLKVTIWRSVGQRLRFEPENGQKVLVYGDITVYERGGQYQLNCRRIQPVGIGELELAFRQLHERLSAEGLFDEDRKRPIPNYPLKIGVVTSPTGAAICDIITIARRRNEAVSLVVYPAQVQGEGAEDTIAEGISYFNGRDDIDVIIIGRGGGSLEDLWAFNTETVVRAVVASRIPLVSAVGHEIDTTLSDLAADLRAPTPSAAAELVVWSKREFKEQLDAHLYAQAQRLEYLVDRAREQLAALVGRPVFRRPQDIVTQRRQYVDQLVRLLGISGKNCFDGYRNGLSLLASKLDALSPLKVLCRGYAVCRQTTSGELVKSVNSVTGGDEIEVIVTDGRIISNVGRTERRNDRKQ